ncbi:helix-turn-helix domain-containing protein [Vibrio natriegens]|uniref:helix-turn-helix domain-containing protein n=1 Tax=Vibrio natriegens TaxID=691 RepID=UPI0035569B31
MKFSSFLKNLRSDFNLSQRQMVLKLAVSHEQFSDLTVVTYSRWERSVSLPPLIKMLYVARIFSVDTFEFLMTIEFKESKNQTLAFANFLSHYYHISNHYRLLSTKLYDEDYFCNEEIHGVEPDLIFRKAKIYWDAILKQEFEPNDNIKSNIIEDLQNNGLLYISSCIEPKSNEILAQGIFTLQSMSEEKKLLHKFNNRTLELHEINKVVDNNDKFIFIPIIAFQSTRWLNFNLYKVIEIFTKVKNIKKIYLVTSQIKAYSKLRYLGFNIVSTIKSEVEDEVFNDCVKSEITTHLISCDFDEFICNHGLVNLIKGYREKLSKLSK